VLNLLRIIFLDKNARLFRSFCRTKLLVPQRVYESKLILVESPGARGNLMGIRLFLGACTKFYGNNVLLYRIAPKQPLLWIKERLRFYFSIEKAMGIKRFKTIVWTKHSASFYKEFYQDNCGVNNPFEFEYFEYKKILIGDLIYDEYLRRSKKRTIDFNDIHFHRIFYELIVYFNQYSEIFEKFSVGAVVVSNCTYHFAIPLRIGCSFGIPCYQVTSETMYKISSSRLHSYTEFLDYGNRLQLESKEFYDSLPRVKSRIERRLAGNSEMEVLDFPQSPFFHSDRIIWDSGNPEIKILVATHDFSDSPHSYGFNFYPDFYIWLETLGRISEKTNYKWYLKPHPKPIGNSDKVLTELERRFPKFEVLPSDISHHELIRHGINFALTVFGTIGWEYPALGIPVINASKNNPHVNFNFSITPSSRAEYETILLDLEKLKDFHIDKAEVEQFFYLHNDKKLYSFIYRNYEQYLHKLGYENSTSSHALGFYVECKEEDKHPESEILSAISRFIESNDFRLDYKHFI